MRRLRCRCGKRFTPKRRNQRHHSTACRIAAYNASGKGTARRQRYNASEKRKRVQAAYNRSEKGGVRRDRWQYGKAGRAWRKAWTAPDAVAERRKRQQEEHEAELRQRMQRLAAESGVSLTELVRTYFVSAGHYNAKYLRVWLQELEKAA